MTAKKLGTNQKLVCTAGVVGLGGHASAKIPVNPIFLCLQKSKMAAITLALSNQKHSPDLGQRRHQGRFVLTISQRGVEDFGETFWKMYLALNFLFTLKARLNTVIKFDNRDQNKLLANQTTS